MNSNTNILPNENIFDVAIRVYGHNQGIFNIVKDNDLSFSSEPGPGIELIIDETANYSEFLPANVILAGKQQKVEIAAQPNQNIYDLAIQQYGSIEGVFLLVKNNNISLSTKVEVGFNLDATGEPVVKLVYKWFRSKANPATGSEIIVDAQPVLEGIDYWAIEIDFIVQ